MQGFKKVLRRTACCPSGDGIPFGRACGTRLSSVFVTVVAFDRPVASFIPTVASFAPHLVNFFRLAQVCGLTSNGVDIGLGWRHDVQTLVPW